MVLSEYPKLVQKQAEKVKLDARLLVAPRKPDKAEVKASGKVKDSSDQDVPVGSGS